MKGHILAGSGARALLRGLSVLITLVMSACLLAFVFSAQATHRREFGDLIREVATEYFLVRALKPSSDSSYAQIWMLNLQIEDYLLVKEQAVKAELVAALSNAIHLPRIHTDPRSPRSEGDRPSKPPVLFREVSPEFFAIMGLAVLEGRLFTALDAGAELAVLGADVTRGELSSMFAHPSWSSGSYTAVGQLLRVSVTGPQTAYWARSPERPNTGWTPGQVNICALVPLGALPIISLEGEETDLYYGKQGYDLLVTPKPGHMNAAMEEVRALLAHYHDPEREWYLEIIPGPRTVLVLQTIEEVTAETFASMALAVYLICLLGVACLGMVRLSRSLRWLGIKRVLGARGRELLDEEAAYYTILGVCATLAGTTLFLALSWLAGHRPVFGVAQATMTAGAVVVGSVLSGLAPALRVIQREPLEVLNERSLWKLRGVDFRRVVCCLAVGLAVAAAVAAGMVSRASVERVDGYLRAMGAGTYIVRSTTGELTPVVTETLELLAARHGGTGGKVQPLEAAVSGPSGSVGRVDVLETSSGWLDAAGWELARGTMPGGTGVLLGAGLAVALFGDKDPVGQVVRLAEQPVEVTGVLAPRPAGVLDRDRDRNMCAVLHPDNALRLVRILPPEIWVRGDNDAPELAATVETFTRAHGLILEDVLVDLAVLRAAAAMSQRVYRLLAVLAMMLAAANLAGVMTVLAYERRSEFGVYRALGAHRWEVGRLMMGESLRLSLSGTVPALAGGLFLAIVISRQRQLPISWDPGWLSACVALTMTSGGLSGLAGALSLMRQDPSQLLVEE